MRTAEDYHEEDKQISKEVSLEMQMHPYLHKYFYESGYDLNHVQMRWVCLAIRDHTSEITKPIIEMLKQSRCPNGDCDNNGTITTGTMGADGLPEPTQEQCQWCWEREMIIR